MGSLPDETQTKFRFLMSLNSSTGGQSQRSKPAPNKIRGFGEALLISSEANLEKPLSRANPETMVTSFG